MLISENSNYQSDFQDIRLERAWEKDLQKTSSPINQGVPLYGHLQFISEQISLEKLRESKDIIFEIMCKDIFGKECKVRVPFPKQDGDLSKNIIRDFKHGVNITLKKA